MRWKTSGVTEFLQRGMGLRAVPSAATLRQRLEEAGARIAALTDELPVPLRKHARAAFTALSTGHVALELDVI